MQGIVHRGLLSRVERAHGTHQSFERIARYHFMAYVRQAERDASSVSLKFKSASRVTPMEHDLIKLVDELFKPTKPQKATTETQKPVLLESILPPEGRAWLNGLNPF